MQVTFRPISGDWPGKRRSPSDRRSYTFKASWSSTMSLLDRELRALDARNVVFQVDVRESDLRLDGLPRADAKFNDAAVIISFDSKYGPLRYFCDFASHWQHNVRAIALGLEHLRLVDRYGITKRGEQYAGWKALPPGSGVAHGVVMQFATARDAAAWILEKAANGEGLGAVGGRAIDTLLADESYRDSKFRQVAKRVHPDVGGSRVDWDTFVEARRIVETEA